VPKSPSDIDHLSVSSIKLYMSCPRSWAAQYLDEIPRKLGAALVKGRAVDAASTHNWGQKRHSGEDIGTNEAEEVAEAAYYDDVDKAGGRSEVDWGRSNFGAELDSAMRLTTRHMIDHAPLWTPVAVQKRWKRRLSDGRDVLGYIDAVLTEDGSELVDVKTGSAKMNEASARGDIQPTAYLWASGKPGTLTFARVIHTRAGNLSSELVVAERTAEQLAGFEELAEGVSSAINNAVFPRINGHHCEWCPINLQCAMSSAKR